MVYYHIGRVIEVLRPGKDVVSADTSTQAVVETWDENVITFEVARKLASKIKPGDIVLIDYTPISSKVVMPKMVITKIIKGKKAETIWEEYKEYFRRRPRVKPSTPKVVQRPKPTYVG